MHDLVIRGGTIVDGSGTVPFKGCVAVDGDRIVAVGEDLGPARREIDARGKIVTPGWVDIHSHYDGQATWDAYLSPSGAHGVTTVVMGNCGVGFAPVRPDSHNWLIGLMEGVEDIPGTALAEGIRWGWEDFPQYMDKLAEFPRAVDVAAQIPHSAVRAYVMGEREAIRGTASKRQIAEMSSIVSDGIKAGALGFSSSRTKLHLAADGSPVPGSFAELEELMLLGKAMSAAGGGVFQIVSDFTDPALDFEWLTRIAANNNLPVLFTLVQYDDRPSEWRQLLSMTEGARAAGVRMTPLVGNRPVGMLINLESKTHPFSDHPSFAPLLGLSRSGKVRHLRDPALRARLLAEETRNPNKFWRLRMRQFDNMYRLGIPPDYEPSPELSFGAQARREARNPLELVYDALLERDGDAWIYLPLINYSDHSLQPQLEMMNHPHTLIGLADGGAHCGLICDATAPTFMLVHWVKNRNRGRRLTLERAVWMQTERTARFYGMNDRGRLATGRLADINVIDFAKLELKSPYWAADLPAGGRRLLQDAVGYDYTVKRGVVTWQGGQATQELPGQLVRGPQGGAFG
jgi:N-acyl-D-amino-acid deacylase